MGINEQIKKDFAALHGTMPILGGFDGVGENQELTPGKKNPLDILKELGYTHEVHEDGKDHFVKYDSVSKKSKNPYYIAVVQSLIVEKMDDAIRVSFYLNDGICFRTFFYCGYSRARNMAVRMVISWHHIGAKGRK